MKASKVEIESSFYEYLTRVLTAEEAEAFAASLDKLVPGLQDREPGGFRIFRKRTGR